MKPGRLQNALKSFGRAPKCFKILWPGFKMLWNPSAGLQNPWNSRKCRLGGSQKLQNPRKSRKCDFFRHQIVPNSITGMERSILNTLWKKNETILFSSFLVRLAFLNRIYFGSGAASFLWHILEKIIKVYKYLEM